MLDRLSGMKVLHVATMAEVLVHFKLPLLEMLSRAGAVQSIYCSDEQYCMDRGDSYNEGGHLKALYDLGYNVHVGPITRRPSFRTFYEILALSRHIKSAGYDIVMSHQSVAAMVAMPAANLAGTPVKIISSGGLRVVTPLDRLLNRHGENMMIRLSDAILVNNREDYEYVRGLRGGLLKARLVGAMEGCGIDTDEINPETRLDNRLEIRRKLSLDDSVKVVSYAGRLVWEKGIKELIEAASTLQTSLPGVRIVYLIIGIGPDAKDMQDMIERAGLTDKFMFTGYRFDIIKYLSASDIFVLPSYREGLPTTLLQAMALGLSCIATNIRGSRELIDDKISGLIVNPHESGALAQAITTILDDPAMAEAMGRQARRTVEERYSRGMLLPRTMDTIREIISAGPY